MLKMVFKKGSRTLLFSLFCCIMIFIGACDSGVQESNRKEVEEIKIKQALIPHEQVNKQYAFLGSVDGVRSCLRKLEEFYGRESY